MKEPILLFNYNYIQMKKYFYLAVALCMGFAMTSCDDDDDVPPVVKTATLDFEGDKWTKLIDNPQYGGPLIYSADEYKWEDSNTKLSSECIKADWTQWDMGYGWNNGIAISNYVDAEHATYMYQLSVPKTNGSKNFAVVWDSNSALTFTDGKAHVIKSMQIMNTTYGLGSIKTSLGEGFKFAVKVVGMVGEVEKGNLEIVLAEGNTAVEDWTTVDLSSLGAVTSVVFNFESTDENTAKYFAFDNVVVEL